MSHDEDPNITPSSPLGAVPTVHTHGDEDMTPEQAAILRELCEKTGEPMDGALTRQQADQRIEALRDQAGKD